MYFHMYLPLNQLGLTALGMEVRHTLRRSRQQCDEVRVGHGLLVRELSPGVAADHLRHHGFKLVGWRGASF